MIWMGFLGASLALRNGSHVGITMIGESPARPVRRIVTLAASLGVLAWFVVTAYGAAFLLETVSAEDEPRPSNQHVSPVSRGPRWHHPHDHPVGAANDSGVAARREREGERCGRRTNLMRRDAVLVSRIRHTGALSFIACAWRPDTMLIVHGRDVRGFADPRYPHRFLLGYLRHDKPDSLGEGPCASSTTDVHWCGLLYPHGYPVLHALPEN